jgi:hypothetical protein
MKKLLSILFVTAIFFASCEKWIDPEINTDPDNPKDVAIDALLPAIEGAFGYYYGGIDIVGIQSVWMQQLTGSDRQFVAINNYTIRQSDPNNLWNSLYQGVMMDVKQMIEKAENGENKDMNVAGVGKIMMALSLSTATDVWGDIPYSEALMGDENLTPSYDSQESIYAEIDRLLVEAIENLESDDNTLGIRNDYIYGGSAALWIKAANTLRARFQMRLTKVSTVDFDAVISLLDDGISSLDDDMEVVFDGSSSAGYNPLYQFIEQRSGYISSNGYYDTIHMRNDVRDGIQSWSANGFWTSQGSPVHITGATEALFLKAEAQYRNGDVDDAKETLVDAVESSIDKYKAFLVEKVFPLGYDADSAFSAHLDAFEDDVDALTGEAVLETIIVEKYKHMFAHPEPYNDYRRTGYPDIAPVQGTQVPRRYPYPQDEASYNADNVPSVNQFQRVWWDAE